MATYLGAVIAPSADYPGYYVAVECYLDSQDIATNVSTGHNVVTAVAAGSLRDFTATYWQQTISGATTGFADGTTAANFIGGNFVLNGNVPWTATHDTDGKRTITVAFNWAGASGGNFANGFAGSAAFTLPQISRATTPTLPTTADIGSALTISLPRASALFTHDVTAIFGTKTVTIATGAGVTASWTPDMDLLTEIPMAQSGTTTVTVITKNGGTVVGTRQATMTLTAPASAVPSFTTVTHAEATTSPDVAGIITGYVQSISKLALAITGAAGLHGSTITAYKLEVLKGAAVLQTLTVASGTTTPIQDSGALTLRGTVTDSRGRSATKTVSVTVLAYTQPAPTAIQVRRADAAGTLAPTGIYARVDFSAVVQSLIVGTQKNALQYRVLTKTRASSTWSNPAWVSPGGLAFASYALAAGTVPSGESRDVRVEVRDALGVVSTIQGILTTAAAALFLSKVRDAISVGMEYDEALGGSLQAAEVMFQRIDKRVLDVTDLATTTTPGIRALATNAQAQAGTATDVLMTPAAAAAVTATEARAGRIPLATVAQTLAMTDDVRAVTPLKVASLRPWIPDIPTGLASSGATATYNSTTGVITLPTGCTMVRIDGVLSADYETQLMLDLEVNSGHATDNSAFMRMVEGTTPNTSASYNTGGTWGQYNGLSGVYAVSSGTIAAIGAVSNSYASFTTTAFLRPFALNGGTAKQYFYTFDSFTGGSARGVTGGGYTPPATTAFSGLQLYFNGALTGAARGTVRLFWRKLT